MDTTGREGAGPSSSPTERGVVSHPGDEGRTRRWARPATPEGPAARRWRWIVAGGRARTSVPGRGSCRGGGCPGLACRRVVVGNDVQDSRVVGRQIRLHHRGQAKHQGCPAACHVLHVPGGHRLMHERGTIEDVDACAVGRVESTTKFTASYGTPPRRSPNFGVSESWNLSGLI